MKNIVGPQVISYIDKTVDSALDKVRFYFDKKFDDNHHQLQKEMTYRTGVIVEEFQSRLQLMGETVDVKIRETTREVIREEVTPRFEILETKMDMVVKEIGGINDEISGIKSEIGGINDEISGIKSEIGGIKKEISGVKSEVGGVKTEIAGIKNEMGGMKSDISCIKNDLSQMKSGIEIFSEEMKALRKDSNYHHTRLTRLERAVA